MKTDQKTLALIKKLQEKREAIAKAEKPNWKTSCTISLDTGTNVHNKVNIATVRDTSVLIDILAFLVAKQMAWSIASEALTGKELPFKWQSYSVEDWQADLETRATKIDLEARRKECDVLEARLNGIISPELRAEIELEELTKLI